VSAAYGSSTVKRRRSTTQEIRALAMAVIAAVDADKPVTLRGVFYRVVSVGAIDKTELGYRKIGRVLLKLRRAGIVGYDDITDGTRFLRQLSTWDRMEDMLSHAAASYRWALWSDQASYVLLFTEKDAISGTIMPVVNEWDIPLGVLRGYSSESFAWQAAGHIRWALYRNKTVHVYQLGDHDPSGVSAWESFTERVRSFLGDDQHGVYFERLAVLPWQIQEWGLPTRPTKTKDPRAGGFSGESVEVDAIPAQRLRQIVRDAIERHIDPEALRLTRIAEQSEREILRRIGGQQ
jgi:hypothetical protein